MYVGFDKLLSTIIYLDITMVRAYKHVLGDTRFVSFELYIVDDFTP